MFLQIYDWLVNTDLWGGDVSDSDYNKHVGYMQAQKEFQDTSLVKVEVIEFPNGLYMG